MKIQKVMATAVLMNWLGAHAQPNVVEWGGSSAMSTVPVDVTNALAISCNKSNCVALRAEGTIASWGLNTSIGNTALGVADISLGGWQGLALLTNGTVQSIYGPAVPYVITNAVAISAGGSNSLALLSDGRVMSWGLSAVLTNVPLDLTSAIAVSAGGSHCLALGANGKVYAWGNNSLGVTNVPASLTNAVAISAGGYHCAALRQDGTVIVWGGSLAATRAVPTNATNIVAIAAGGLHTLALSANGTVFQWGPSVPNVPTNLQFTVAIAAGTNCSMAIVDLSQESTPPTIMSAGPLSQNVAVGSAAYLTVRALSYSALSYQWYFEDTLIQGATNRTLVLNNIQIWQSGRYKAVVSNVAGSTLSAFLQVNVAPVLGIMMTPTITMYGQVGSNYELDYVNQFGPTGAWQVLTTLVLNSNPQLYFDTSAIGQPARLYRLVQIP